MMYNLSLDEAAMVCGGNGTVTTSEVLAAGAAMTGTTAAVTCGLGIAPACAAATGVTLVLAGSAAIIAMFEE